MHQAQDLDSFSIIQNIHSNTNIPDISQELHLRFPFLWIMISWCRRSNQIHIWRYTCCSSLMKLHIVWLVSSLIKWHYMIVPCYTGIRNRLIGSFVLDLVLCDSKKGGGSLYGRARTVLMIKNEPYWEISAEIRNNVHIYIGTPSIKPIHIVYSFGGHQINKKAYRTGNQL